jgi:hypothetical protein
MPVRGDFLVELRGFEPPTPAVRAPPAKRLRASKAYCRGAAGPNASRRRLHLPFAGPGRGRRIDAGSCPEGGPALDTSNMPAHVLNWLCA